MIVDNKKIQYSVSNNELLIEILDAKIHVTINLPKNIDKISKIKIVNKTDHLIYINLINVEFYLGDIYLADAVLSTFDGNNKTIKKFFHSVMIKFNVEWDIDEKFIKGLSFGYLRLNGEDFYSQFLDNINVNDLNLSCLDIAYLPILRDFKSVATPCHLIGKYVQTSEEMHEIESIYRDKEIYDSIAGLPYKVWIKSARK